MFSMENLMKHNLPSVLYYASQRMDTRDFKRNTPVSLTIRPTSICNRDCNFCLSGSSNKHMKGNCVDKETMAKCFDIYQQLDIHGITLAGGGEPTTMKPDNLQGLFEGPYKVYIHTNGIYIDRFWNQNKKRMI